MADNIIVDNADLLDFTAASDEVQVGGTQPLAQVQFVKLVDGTLNGTAPIEGTAANGLEVDVTRIAAGDNNIGNVDVVTLPALPAGANNIGDVDVLTLPALAAGTNNIGDVDVLTLPALPAGTNNIGDVDVLSVVPGTTAAALGKAEDGAHTTGDTGVMLLAVRKDAAGTLGDTDLDYVPLQVDSAGAVRVTGAGGGTQYNEGDIDATITGTAILWEDTSDTLRAASATNPFPTNVVASASTTDSVAASLRTDILSNNLTSLTPKFAIIDNAAAGDNTLVASVASKKIRVHQAILVCSGGENTVRFESGASGTALTGQMTISDNQGFVLPFSPIGWFETAATTLLNLELSGATSVDGVLAYTEV